MSVRKQKNKINLLPQKGLSSTVAGRILFWVLSTFRVIVIVTELMVMVAFLSRFWLDAENTDLNEEIAQKQAVIVASLGFENKFKDTQARLKIFSELATQEELISNSLDVISSSLPPDVFLKSLSFLGDNVTIESVSPNEKSIQQLIVNLDSTDMFKEVELAGINTNKDGSALLQFKIAAKTQNSQTFL